MPVSDAGQTRPASRRRDALVTEGSCRFAYLSSLSRSRLAASASAQDTQGLKSSPTAGDTFGPSKVLAMAGLPG
jgi:hypothetical protein